MVHGSDYPVCVPPMACIDMAIELAIRPEVLHGAFGDALRVPGSTRRSLLRAKADGAEVRMVCSAADGLANARAEPACKIVYFAIGFETTTPAVALARARAEGVSTFSVFSNHVPTPPAIRTILRDPAAAVIDGVFGPSHVSGIVGADASSTGSPARGASRIC
jgi:hydrogenase expression/formation protein HypD